MARFVREVPADVARQALVNKTLNASQVQEAAKGPEADVDEDELEILAGDIAVPELMPYEYAYVDVLTDGRGTFYLSINDRYYRRSVAKRIQPG